MEGNCKQCLYSKRDDVRNYYLRCAFHLGMRKDYDYCDDYKENINYDDRTND